jgi:hypothetical protein
MFSLPLPHSVIAGFCEIPSLEILTKFVWVVFLPSIYNSCELSAECLSSAALFCGLRPHLIFVPSIVPFTRLNLGWHAALFCALRPPFDFRAFNCAFHWSQSWLACCFVLCPSSPI